MSSYSKVLERVSANGLNISRRGFEPDEEVVIETDPVQLNVPAPIPFLPKTPFEISRARSLQTLNERIVPMIGVGKSVRLLVTGCRPSDGASTVAMALALDTSGRLGLRTLLVDAHLRKPDLHKFLPPSPTKAPPLLLGDQFVVRVTGLPRLELASCLPMTADTVRSRYAAGLEALLDGYPLTIVDLGVVRLDGRLLALARPEDPVVMVVRYGHTEREELETTAVALKAASRKVAGVIMNTVSDVPLPASKRPRISS